MILHKTNYKKARKTNCTLRSSFNLIFFNGENFSMSQKFLEPTLY